LSFLSLSFQEELDAKRTFVTEAVEGVEIAYAAVFRKVPAE
jgi:hypothetical protein